VCHADVMRQTKHQEEHHDRFRATDPKTNPLTAQRFGPDVSRAADEGTTAKTGTEDGGKEARKPGRMSKVRGRSKSLSAAPATPFETGGNEHARTEPEEMLPAEVVRLRAVLGGLRHVKVGDDARQQFGAGRVDACRSRHVSRSSR
jgi:hypothetical protein